MKIQIALVLAVMLSACNHKPAPQQSAVPGPCDIALAPTSDAAITKLQTRVRDSKTPLAFLEQLGWAYIAKAHTTFDPGYYKLAEQTALCMESKKPGSAEAMLLRGRVLHSLHKFKEGEVVARELVAKRGLHFDYGLLGDVLMEQGRLDEAADAYQTMMDQKPSPQAYSRAAHLRWLKGDLPGAIELMQLAAGSGNEPWFRVRLALYELQAGNTERAAALVSEDNSYPPALLARGRVLLSQGKAAEAIEPLQRAAQATQLPEYLWVLDETQRAAGRSDEAKITEEILKRRGAADDPRTYALYLATRGEDVETALKLAQEELKARADVFTLDAVAWAWMAAGDQEQAAIFMRRALAEGTQDARLQLHARIVLGTPVSVRPELLLPSEKTLLAAHPVLQASRN